MTTQTATRERAILFSSEMIRAILRDQNPKTQTRRIVKPQPTRGDVIDPGCDASGHMTFREGWHWNPTPDHHHIWHDDEDQNEGLWAPWFLSMCPHGQPGDRLWVKETCCLDWSDEVVYKADDPTGKAARKAGYAREPKWRSPIFMPRHASRITLEITSVRIEHLQQITEEDAIAEGIDIAWLGNVGWLGTDAPSGAGYSYTEAFYRLWDLINGSKKGCSWNDNPWVWCISFKRIKP